MRRVASLAPALLLLLAGCSPGDAPDRPGGAAGRERPPAEVAGVPTAAGTHRLKLDAGGVNKREYRLRVPPQLADRRWRDGRPAEPLPLVVAMHGGAANAERMERISGLDETADREGVLVAYPEGWLMSWNAGFCCGPAKLAKTDDIGFITELVGRLTDAGLADPDRVYATGFSNGAAMAYRLACEAPGTFAAIGAVSAAMAMPRCDPAPTSVLVMHGTRDGNVPYDGGGRIDWNDPRSFPPVSHAVDYWRKENGLPPLGRTLEVGDGPDCRTTGRGGAGTEVALCRIEGGGHAWPEGAHNTLWTFFEDHPRRD
ncbi:alpha/beta hydrolase family esterase [Thermomonospora cellulosilytica]|uniref:Polyhydroxybutyrate depolymerase n=1 Tax=Thermomonospora cellulosilytica TaxID=1411118 RepID=A0A7W3RC74_9ACTN|nr:PHB depolymerase family esterase [Thermomonospora cellulosilytica]MBA9007636.1 polyhydroxybutyrate depolymerase [Thermomonospora cellulosilytica]